MRFETVLPTSRYGATALALGHGEAIAATHPLGLYRLRAHTVEKLDLPNLHPENFISAVAEDGSLLSVHPVGIYIKTGDEWSTEPIDVGDVWAIERIDDRTYVASTTGIYELAGTDLRRIADEVTFAMTEWNGEIIFAASTGTIHQLSSQDTIDFPQLPVITPVVSFAVFHDSLWAGTGDGLYVLDGEAWELHAVDPADPHAFVFDLAAGSDALYANVKDVGLARLDEDGWHEITTTDIEVAELQAIAVDPATNELWLAFDGGIAVSRS